MNSCFSHFRRNVRCEVAFALALVGAACLSTFAAPASAQDEAALAVEAHEDWRVSCPGETADSCRVWQRVQVPYGDDLQDVMAVSVAPADGGLVVLFQVPLDVYLPADFGLRVDGTGERRVRYRNCNETGCWVLMRGDSGVLSSFRRGITAEAALSLVEGETVRISFSLRGFTAAMAAFEDARQDFE
ncbi:invasion associated locus B family protein [Gymnodinialimonas hymeniacidonis]|uniref:invasion associated locus B family protein n=1 Tax=Gymnodinialimonas hymeniacidonis TaxID=3126508 RepID=UPI0034C652CA